MSLFTEGARVWLDGAERSVPETPRTLIQTFRTPDGEPGAYAETAVWGEDGKWHTIEILFGCEKPPSSGE